MEFMDVVNKRHSVRSFSEKEIPTELLRKIAADAQRTPSWENSQPWNLYIATGKTLKDLLDKFAKQSAEKIKGHPDMPTGHRTNFSGRSQQNMKDFMSGIEAFAHDPGNERFEQAQDACFHAPAVAYLTLASDHTGYSIYDMGAFGLLLMLAAKNEGVDTIPAYTLVKYPDLIKEALDIPEGEDIIMGIALGYADDDIMNDYASPRLPLDEVLKIKD